LKTRDLLCFQTFPSHWSPREKKKKLPYWKGAVLLKFRCKKPLPAAEGQQNTLTTFPLAQKCNPRTSTAGILTEEKLL
jgi:hypothetical protein